jgi:hypothetical protein
MGVCQAAVLSNVIMISARSRARRAAPMLVPDRAARVKRARRNPTNRARGTARRRSHGRDSARCVNAATVRKTPIMKATGASNTPRNTPSGFTRRPARRLNKTHSRREKPRSHSSRSNMCLSERGLKSY